MSECGLSKLGEEQITLLCKRVTRCKMDLDKVMQDLNLLKVNIRSSLYKVEKKLEE